MKLDFSDPGKVKVSMTDYLEEMIASAPLEFFNRKAATPAANFLFDTDEDAELLSPHDAKRFYTHTMQGMWVAKRGRPDALLPVAYLATRVKKPTVHD